MSEARNALIIANYRYEHSDLRQLLAPAQDAESLAQVLSDPGIGGFEVRTVINEPSHKVSLEIEGFCDNRKRDDLLVLYFSGHGIKDADGQLYFATIDTQLVHQNVRRATAVSASFVNEVMSRSRSRRQILLLDCCYSGAFKEGMLAKGGKRAGAGEQLEGQGRIVLTASDALQYSFEGGQVQGQGVRSVFTRILVRGLETGEADLDRDGSFSLDEVYDYVYGKVTDEQPEQRPIKMGYVEGKIFIGNNPRPIAAELPAELQQSLDNPLPWVRKGAVDELEKLLKASNKGLVLAAHAALTSLATGDDSQEVRTKAIKSLAAFADIRSPKAKEVATERKERALPTQPELSTGTRFLSAVGKRDEGKDTHATATPAEAEIEKIDKKQAERLQPDEIPADNLQSDAGHAQEPVLLDVRDAWFSRKRSLTTETSRGDSVRLAKWVLAAASVIGVAGMTWYFAPRPISSTSTQVDNVAGEKARISDGQNPSPSDTIHPTTVLPEQVTRETSKPSATKRGTKSVPENEINLGEFRIYAPGDGLDRSWEPTVSVKAILDIAADHLTRDPTGRIIIQIETRLDDSQPVVNYLEVQKGVPKSQIDLRLASGKHDAANTFANSFPVVSILWVPSR